MRTVKNVLWTYKDIVFAHKSFCFVTFSIIAVVAAEGPSWNKKKDST